MEIWSVWWALKSSGECQNRVPLRYWNTPRQCRAHKEKCRKLFVFYLAFMCLSFPPSLTSIQYRSLLLKDWAKIHAVSVIEVEMVKIWIWFHITYSIITVLQLELLFHLSSINYWLTAIIYESLKSVRRFGLFCLHYENVLSGNLKKYAQCGSI